MSQKFARATDAEVKQEYISRVRKQLNEQISKTEKMLVDLRQKLKDLDKQ